MFENSFCNFERFELPDEGAQNVIDTDIHSDEPLSHKLEQIGFEIQSTLLDKDMIKDKKHFKDKAINQAMGNAHYYAAILRELVLECVSLEEKAGLRKKK